MNWLEALPCILSIEAIPNKTGLLPHEVLMSRPFPLGVLMNRKPAMDLTQLQEKRQEYVQTLFSFVQVFSVGD